MAAGATGCISEMQCAESRLGRSLRGLICHTHQPELQRGGLASPQQPHLWSSRCCRFTTFASTKWRSGWARDGSGGRGGAGSQNLDSIKKKKRLSIFSVWRWRRAQARHLQKTVQTVCFVLSFKEQVDAQSAGDDEDDDDDADRLVRS